MNFVNDISLGSLISTGTTSVMVLVVGWALRAVAKVLVAAIGKLITTLLDTIKEIHTLKTQLTGLIESVGDIKKMQSQLQELVTLVGTVEKMKTDQNAFFKRLGEFEKKLDSH